MTPAKIVLRLRLSVKDQPFVNIEMNLKNVIANEQSLCFHLSGLEFMQKHKSSFCLNLRLVNYKNKSHIRYICFMSYGWIFFLSNIGCFNLCKNQI